MCSSPRRDLDRVQPADRQQLPVPAHPQVHRALPSTRISSSVGAVRTHLRMPAAMSLKLSPSSKFSPNCDITTPPRPSFELGQQLGAVLGVRVQEASDPVSEVAEHEPARVTRHHPDPAGVLHHALDGVDDVAVAYVLAGRSL
jgi:hypothetical protein